MSANIPNGCVVKYKTLNEAVENIKILFNLIFEEKSFIFFMLPNNEL